MTLDRPLVLFAFSVVILLLSVQLGTFVGSRRPIKEDERNDLDVVISSALTLLALIIGFSFAMALSRYDQRKNYEEEEANAIGTEYVRATLLPAADQARVQQLLTQYLEQRLLFYTIRDPGQLEQVDTKTAELQSEMWSIVQNVALAQPTPPLSLALSGMNDVLNTQGYTQAAWWNRIPVAAWALMVALAVFCCLLIGYRARRRGVYLLAVLPIIISVAFFLIADIDSPRSGPILVSPQNLISLSQSLRMQ